MADLEGSEDEMDVKVEHEVDCEDDARAADQDDAVGSLRSFVDEMKRREKQRMGGRLDYATRLMFERADKDLVAVAVVSEPLCDPHDTAILLFARSMVLGAVQLRALQ